MTTPPAGAPVPGQLTAQDAQDLLNLASNAPLPGGLVQARKVDQLLLRAQVFFTAHFTEAQVRKELASAAGKKPEGKPRGGKKDKGDAPAGEPNPAS